MYEWNQITGGDAAETGSGPGSYNIRKRVWHVNCCNPELNGSNGGWGVFNSLFGWTNSATYGTVISYNLYWLAVILAFVAMRSFEKNGHWPLMKAKAKDFDDETLEKSSSDGEHGGQDDNAEEKVDGQSAPASSNVREIQA